MNFSLENVRGMKLYPSLDKIESIRRIVINNHRESLHLTAPTSRGFCQTSAFEPYLRTFLPKHPTQLFRQRSQTGVEFHHSTSMMEEESGKVLFELPIAATSGKVVCTQPAKQVYLITWTSGADNRLLTVRLPPQTHKPNNKHPN